MVVSYTVAKAALEAAIQSAPVDEASKVPCPWTQQLIPTDVVAT